MRCCWKFVILQTNSNPPKFNMQDPGLGSHHSLQQKNSLWCWIDIRKRQSGDSRLDSAGYSCVVAARADCGHSYNAHGAVYLESIPELPLYSAPLKISATQKSSIWSILQIKQPMHTNHLDVAQKGHHLNMKHSPWETTARKMTQSTKFERINKIRQANVPLPNTLEQAGRKINAPGVRELWRQSI